MSVISHIPITDDYFDQLGKLIYGCSARGESGVFIWFPTGGKTADLKEVLGDLALKSRYLGKYHRYHKFVYLDASANLEATAYPFFLYMHRQLGVKKVLSKFLTSLEFSHDILIPSLGKISKDYEITFVINHLGLYPDEEIKKILRTINFIQSAIKGRVHFQIHERKHSLWPAIIYETGVSLIAQNIHYLPLPKEINSKKILEIWQDLNAEESQIFEQSWEAISSVCGTNLSLLKTSLRIFERERQPLTRLSLYSSEELMRRAKLAWMYLSDEERSQIKRVAEGQNTVEVSDVVRRLLQIGFFIKKGSRYLLNGEIFSHIARLETGAETLSAKIVANTLLLTPTERRVLDFLVSKDRKLCNREEIAEAIWGARALENYSNWAIDQTISRVRNKLPSIGYPSELLKTVKGKGYRLMV